MSQSFATLAVPCPSCGKKKVVAQGKALKCTGCNHEFTVSAKATIGLPQEMVEAQQRCKEAEDQRDGSKRNGRGNKDWRLRAPKRLVRGKLNSQYLDWLVGPRLDLVCPPESLPNDYGEGNNEAPFWRRSAANFSGGVLRSAELVSCDDESEGDSDPIPLELEEDESAA